MLTSFQRNSLDKAGDALRKIEFPLDTKDQREILEIINHWRALHAVPLNSFQILLRKRAKKFCEDPVIAQRAKRLASIHRKLVVQPRMRLSQMQDIAGCRAVMKDLEQLNALVARYKAKKLSHKFHNAKDYISNPKADGYRSYHIVYEYRARRGNSPYDGLRVEIQFRTNLQHAWATAVEAVGVFVRQGLKFNQGNSKWLRFFALMSTAIAAIERTPAVPKTPAKKHEIIRELKALSKELKAREALQIYNISLVTLDKETDAKYFLLQINPEQRTVGVRRFKAKDAERAHSKYSELEARLGKNPKEQIVLISVSDIDAIKKAYPNYFNDTQKFLELVDKALKGEFPKPIGPQLDFNF